MGFAAVGKPAGRVTFEHFSGLKDMVDIFEGRKSHGGSCPTDPRPFFLHSARVNLSTALVFCKIHETLHKEIDKQINEYMSIYLCMYVCMYVCLYSCIKKALARACCEEIWTFVQRRHVSLSWDHAPCVPVCWSSYFSGSASEPCGLGL